MIVFFLFDPVDNACEFALQLLDAAPGLLLIAGIHLRQSFIQLAADSMEYGRGDGEIAFEFGEGRRGVVWAAPGAATSEGSSRPIPTTRVPRGLGARAPAVERSVGSAERRTSPIGAA